MSHLYLAAAASPLNSGDTAWILVSAALVMLMTPGLAFFYGGMVRSKSVLNMLMMNFICLAVVGVLWCFYGFSEAFGRSRWSGLIGWTSSWVGLGDHKSVLNAFGGGGTIPLLAFSMFQLMFAIITPALISGAIADRTKFWGWVLFVALWVTIVYFPVANWVFGTGWILNTLHAEDFAGGTAVHMNAGAAGLALCLVLGKRVGWRRDPMRPHNVPFVLLGASLLWFGWYGFNAGSAVAANTSAALAFTTTTVATCAAVLGWLLVEQVRDGHPTTVGAASGAVAGLVAITPACGFVSPMGGICIGFLAGMICALAVGLKYRLGFDDSLDVVGVHLVGGLVGTVLIGFFGFDGLGGQRGLFYGGSALLLGRQLAAAGAVLGYSFTVSLILGLLIKKAGGFRISPEAEVAGIDEAEHAETAYSFSSVLGGELAGAHRTFTASAPAGEAPVPAGKGA